MLSNLTQSDPRGALFAKPSKVNWLLIFYGWAYQIQYLMVFQIEGIWIANNIQKKNFIIQLFWKSYFSQALKMYAGSYRIKFDKWWDT